MPTSIWDEGIPNQGTFGIASNSILYHHGLKLTEMKEDKSFEDMGIQQMMNSLPMHTMSGFMDKFSLSIIIQEMQVWCWQCIVTHGSIEEYKIFMQ